MEYKILQKQPKLKRSDELVNFTQSVIKMEKEYTRITKGRDSKTSEIQNPQTLPEDLSSDTHERELLESHGNVNFSPIKRKQDAPASEVAKRVRLQESGVRTQKSTSSEPAFENASKNEELSNDVMRTRKHMRGEFGLKDSVIWVPSDTQNDDAFKSGLFNITLSRVYFSQGGEINGNQVPADRNKNSATEPAIKRDCTKDSNTSKFLARQNKSSVNKMISNHAAGFLTNSVSQPRGAGGIFHNQTGSECKKHPDRRSITEVEEYVHFFPEYQEQKAESSRCDTLRCNVKSSSTRLEYIPKEKRSKIRHAVSDDDGVIGTGLCENKVAQSNFVQVVADSDGRILVNFAETRKDERNVKTTKPITVDEEAEMGVQKDHEDPKRNARDLINREDDLKFNGCPSRPKHFEIQNPGTCYQTSALITNDSQWDAWKRVNCVPCNEDDPFFNHCKRHPHFVASVNVFDKEEIDLIRNDFEDENNNYGPHFKTPHLNKFIDTTRYSMPDNSGFCHAVATMQDLTHLKCCDTSIQKGIQKSQTCFESLPNIAEKLEYHSRNCQPTCAFMDNERKCACMEEEVVLYRQARNNGNPNKARAYVIGVNEGQSTCTYNLETRKQSSAPQAYKKDINSNPCYGRESDLVTEINIEAGEREEDSSELVTNEDSNGIQTSCPEIRNKGNPRRIGSNEVVNLQPAILVRRQNGINDSRNTEKDAKRDRNELRENSKSFVNEHDGRYQCDWPACDKTFRHYSFLVLHKRIHTGERPYVCSWNGCSKQFRRSDDYQRHYRVHTGAKPYICVFCSKGFKRSDHRLFHYRAIHNVSRFKKQKR